MEGAPLGCMLASGPIDMGRMLDVATDPISGGDRSTNAQEVEARLDEISSMQGAPLGCMLASGPIGLRRMLDVATDSISGGDRSSNAQEVEVRGDHTPCMVGDLGCMLAEIEGREAFGTVGVRQMLDTVTDPSSREIR